jgi:carbonic anhydrase/acetyltransferase-like protein (isoleucine patch superfamily)
MIKACVPVFLVVIFGVPLAMACAPVFFVQTSYAKITLVCFGPLVFVWSFVLLSGLLSRPFQRAIIKGKFPRQLTDRVYGPRRLYGLCWTSVYYAGPIYSTVLAVPTLRKVLLRLFGYAGDLDFVVYPDTWIRDLPLLKVGRGAYLSNKATIGTNICLNDGTVLVDQVRVDDGAMVGHLTMLGPGAWLEEKAEVGVGVAVGLGARLGKGARVGPCCLVNHGARLGEGTEVGAGSYVGFKARIAGGVRLPAGSNVPADAVIANDDDVRRYLSSETKLLREHADQMAQLYALRAEG